MNMPEVYQKVCRLENTSYVGCWVCIFSKTAICMDIVGKYRCWLDVWYQAATEQCCLCFHAIYCFAGHWKNKLQSLTLTACDTCRPQRSVSQQRISCLQSSRRNTIWAAALWQEQTMKLILSISSPNSAFWAPNLTTWPTCMPSPPLRSHSLSFRR